MEEINKEHLRNLGFKLEENNKGFALTRNNYSRVIDSLAIIFGLLAFPVLGITMGRLGYLRSEGLFDAGHLIPLAIVIALGVYLLLLFFRGWERRMKLSKFYIETYPGGILINEMVNFGASEIPYDSETKLNLKYYNRKTTLILSNSEEEKELLELETTNPEYRETLQETLNLLCNYTYPSTR